MSLAGKRSISNHVKRLRFEKNGMTQAALAEAVGVSRQTINALEANRYSPSLELAFKIALAFDVSLTEVFEYDVSAS